MKSETLVWCDFDKRCTFKYISDLLDFYVTIGYRLGDLGSVVVQWTLERRKAGHLLLSDANTLRPCHVFPQKTIHFSSLSISPPSYPLVSSHRQPTDHL